MEVEVRRRVGLKVGSWSLGGEGAGLDAGCCWEVVSGAGSWEAGMRRKEVGSTLLERVVGGVGRLAESDLGRPRAAAAQERRVVRLERRASSCCAAAL